ncbi:protein of unknown function [Modestobacter italicus]|uniref:Uncharacterized protein n=1 Tax=Modestobacter italicus (strain DSM 44449 / CECT 9708 / BC 501) TaxID=2732864 RepID=I4EVW7_MODI5|nr:protein of unknown function [Modestobacter marinus]
MTGDGELHELGRTSGAHGEVVLRRRGAITELVVDGVFAMDDVDTSTERALATEALRRCPGAGLRVLCGCSSAGSGWAWTRRPCSPTAGRRGRRRRAAAGAGPLGRLPGLPQLPAGRLRLCGCTSGTSRTPCRLPAGTRCCWTSTTARRSWCTSPTPASTPGPGWPRRWRRCGPVGCWRSGPATPRRSCAAAGRPARAADVEHLGLPVQRDGRRFDYAVVLARSAQSPADDRTG